VSTEPTRAASVAVIDVGSNSIKLLAAARGPNNKLRELANRTLEVRLGNGLSHNPPRLETAGIDRAADAVAILLAEAESFGPEQIRIVATSAVRDAVNGDEFVRRVHECYDGRTVEVLSSEEEARLIGRGIACDPGLERVRDFSLFDLGGGSLEMLAFAAGTVAHLSSVPLGCVRLTERFIEDPTKSVSAGQIANIRQHVNRVLEDSDFTFAAGTEAAVVTGGTATTLRAIRANANDQALTESPATITTEELEIWARKFSAQTLDERRGTPGLSSERADVFPAALWTLVELARAAGVPQITHSLYNLRFGVVAETLRV
jgi:exopolyphosphatase/guanosine-5'-triphosphate,3'-diphosphate pyrophosphatase